MLDLQRNNRAVPRPGQHDESHDSPIPPLDFARHRHAGEYMAQLFERRRPRVPLRLGNASVLFADVEIYR